MRELPKSVVRAEYVSFWADSRRFVPVGFRFFDRPSGADHYAGGPALHQRATCPQCGRGLTLLWDLDLNDASFPEFIRAGFAPASRLPFYVCWTCMAAAYAVEGGDRITTFKFPPRTTDYCRPGESLFEDSPDELPRRRIGLERMPSTVDAAISLASNVGVQHIDDEGRKLLDKYCAGLDRLSNDLPFSQFGGEPRQFQGWRNHVCPNPDCPASKLEHPYADIEAQYLMKILASIYVDAEPELKKGWYQIAYYGCRICFSMLAEYRCT